MKKQFNNEPININKLEKGNTGNLELDQAISDLKSEPLVFSLDEATTIVSAAETNAATSSVIKNTILFSGTVLISAVFGWMYYQVTTPKLSSPTDHATQKTTVVINEQNKISLSSSNNHLISQPQSSNINNENEHSQTISNNAGVIANSTSGANTGNTISNTDINLKSSNSKKVIAENNSTIKNRGNQIVDDKKSNTNFSKTIITQRYFDDGSAKMSLEYKNQPARITINARGIESLFINDEEVDPSYYYLYEDLATEAFRRAKIEPLAGAIHDANSKPNLNAMMTGALVRRGLIKDGDKFIFELTNNFASINNTNVKSDVHKDLLQVYQSAFGSSLPRGGRFIIGKQQ